MCLQRNNVTDAVQINGKTGSICCRISTQYLILFTEDCFRTDLILNLANISLGPLVSKMQRYVCSYFCLRKTVNPLPDDKILDPSKFKQIADHILKCI